MITTSLTASPTTAAHRIITALWLTIASIVGAAVLTTALYGLGQLAASSSAHEARCDTTAAPSNYTAAECN